MTPAQRRDLRALKEACAFNRSTPRLHHMRRAYFLRRGWIGADGKISTLGKAVA